MGLHNRDYMRSPYPEPGNDGRGMLLTLIVINAASFFLFRNTALALDMTRGFHLVNLFQLVSAGFAHNDFWHLFFNMWGLYIFGKLTAPYLSKQKFLMLYLAGAVTGNLLYLLTHLNSGAMLLGSSGAVCAMMIAAAMLEPERRFVMIFLPFSPIKTTTLVICYTAMTVLMLIGKDASGISHLAHLGGFIGGYIFMKAAFHGRSLPWDPLRFIKVPTSSQSSTSAGKPGNSHGKNENSSKNANAPVTQRELDALLDKLSHYGINSLSEYELQRLKKARRQMRGEE